jgi:hypothetical protein
VGEHGPAVVDETRQRYDLTKTVTLDVHSMLPPMLTEGQFLAWLLWRLKRIEVHEAREFFRVDDQVWDDPHAEHADRDQ